MRAYIIKRLVIMLPTVILISLAIFFLMRLLPGDIVDAVMAQAGGEGLDRDAVVLKFGLDAPLLTQYARWAGIIPHADGSFDGILQGSLGMSWWRAMPVTDLVARSGLVTLQLGIMGLIASQLIALPIGIYSALRQDKWGDYIGRSFATGLISIPNFWLGTLIIVFPSIWWGYMPPIMLVHFTEDPIGNLKMFIMPALVMGMAMSGLTMRMTRSMVLEVLREDYVRTAWAKGLRERVVIIRHALKNALIPVITLVGIQLPIFLGGTVIVERIFVLPGMGRLIIGAAMERDYPLMSGIMLIFAGALVLVNLAIDLAYAYLDPRIHYK